MANKTTSLSKTFVLKMRVILRDRGGKVLRDLTSRKPRRIIALVRSSAWNSINLTVSYGDTDITNSGTFRSADKFFAAFAAFTEPELIQFVSEAINGQR